MMTNWVQLCERSLKNISIHVKRYVISEPLQLRNFQMSKQFPFFSITQNLSVDADQIYCNKMAIKSMLNVVECIRVHNLK